jgi:ubiquinone biosynthesis protein
MLLALKPSHVRRYKQIARLLFRYGRGDLAREAELDPDPGHGKNGSDRITIAESQPPGAPAEQLASDLESMGPTFIKLGQFLSTRGDLLPASYLRPLARLQDQVGPFAFAEVENIVSTELGVRLSKAFAAFDEQPIAAASLGQVHRAQLRDGVLVAVKVQRPGIRGQIVEDLEALSTIATVLDRRTEVGKRNGFSLMVDEFRKSLMRELDYAQEARNLRVLGENLVMFERILVPSPVPDYVTEHVLTMEFVHGRKITSLGPLARLEVDGGPLAEVLCQAYLHQILVDGFFHADPHPGNIFLTDDDRLALLDLGMVAQLAPDMQETLLKLVLAMSEGRGETAAELMIDMGTPVAVTDADATRRGIVEMVLKVQGMRMRDIALGRLLFETSRCATEGGYRLPQELTMLSKTLLNVDEVSRRLDPDFDPNASIRRNASELMRERMVKSFSRGRMFDGLLELKSFAEKLPRRLNKLFDAVTENRLRIKVDAINEALLMEGMQKIANRVTMGLVISAMIVGAALLMRIDTQFRILGYPGIAILFFLAAGACAFAMMFNIVIHDIRASKGKLKARERQKANDPASNARS